MAEAVAVVFSMAWPREAAQDGRGGEQAAGSGEEHEADVSDPAADRALARRVQGDAVDRSSDRLPLVSAAHQSRAAQLRRGTASPSRAGRTAVR
jgi:hypothetical protein